MKLNKYFLIILGSVISINVFCQDIYLGSAAQDFTLPYATKDTIIHSGIKLSAIIGVKPVILAFYPADWSPGCTKQLCSYRDNFDLFQELDAEILGISGDYVWSHRYWAEHQNYPFKLLSDHTHYVSKMYNSYNEERGFNKRTVFVIDKNGIIVYIDWKYSVSDDVSYVNLKNALMKLK